MGILLALTGATLPSVGELLNNLKQLVELDRACGIEFVGRGAPTPVTTSVVVPRAAVRASVPAAALNTHEPRPNLVLSGLAAADLTTIAEAVSRCRACKLCSTRTKTVPGEGAATPELVFVGEGPGAEEDAAGRPFVGAAGQLLDRMITAMGFAREQVFIANVVKCRPPGNRNPEPDEVAACLPFLETQLATLKPKVICTLGNVPLRALMGADTPGITKVRGQRLSWRGVVLIPTFHPSYLLRNDEAKKPAWDDLKQVLAVLGRPPPARGAPAPIPGG